MITDVPQPPAFSNSLQISGALLGDGALLGAKDLWATAAAFTRTRSDGFPEHIHQKSVEFTWTGRMHDRRSLSSPLKSGQRNRAYWSSQFYQMCRSSLNSRRWRRTTWASTPEGMGARMRRVIDDQWVERGSKGREYKSARTCMPTLLLVRVLAGPPTCPLTLPPALFWVCGWRDEMTATKTTG